MVLMAMTMTMTGFRILFHYHLRKWFQATYTWSIFLLFRVTTLNQKVTLGAEMGEEMALRVLAAKILQKVYLVSSSPKDAGQYTISAYLH